MWFTRLSWSPRKLAPGTSDTQGTSRAWSMRAMASLDQSSSCACDGCGVSGRMIGFIVMLRLSRRPLSRAGSACSARGCAASPASVLRPSTGPQGRRPVNPSADRRGLTRRRTAGGRAKGGWEPLVVGEIWRYPVKSMGGERLDIPALTADGIPGDRVVHARDASHVLTARSHPALLAFH